MRRLLALACFLLLATAARADRRAVIVGVDQYTYFKSANLEGCVNDAKLMRLELTKRFKFPEANITLLTNGDATAAAILAALRANLAQSSKPGDTVVFYFSGHGSQMPDADHDEADGLDEVLCAADINKDAEGHVTGAVSDDQLDQLLKLLAGREFVAIFDCCHSGTGLRGGLSTGRSRFLQLESAPAPPPNPDDLLAGSRALELTSGPPPAEAAYRDIEKSNGGMTTLIAACRSNEKAQENIFEVEGATETHGALTVKLAKAFRGEAAGNRAITYDDLNRYLNNPLVTGEREQHPQLESPPAILDRAIFSGLDPKSAAAPFQADAATSASAAVAPLKVYLAEYRSFFGADVPRSGADFDAVEKLLKAKPFIQLCAARDASDIAVFYGESKAAGAKFVVGTLLPGGGVSRRVNAAQIGETELQPVLDDLRRVHLVNSLMRMRNPGSGHDADLTLEGKDDMKKQGQPLVFHVTSKRAGYLTLLNVDCQGNITQLAPNSFQPEVKIAAGGAVTIPDKSWSFELEVNQPVGREFMKAFLTDRPLKVPAMVKTRSIGQFKSIATDPVAGEYLTGLTRAVGGTKSPAGADKLDIEALKPAEWGEASLVFYTAEK